MDNHDTDTQALHKIAIEESHYFNDEKHDTNSLHEPASGTITPVNRFSLDTIIEAEGMNLSVGERSLLSLARALVKDSKVVILDEAT